MRTEGEGDGRELALFRNDLPSIEWAFRDSLSVVGSDFPALLACASELPASWLQIPEFLST